jgi:hypothetical protein
VAICAFYLVVQGFGLDDWEQVDRLWTDQFVIITASVGGVAVIGVEVVVETAVGVIDVARETVRKWSAGDRRSSFPAPRTVLTGDQKIWRWTVVHAWAAPTFTANCPAICPNPWIWPRRPLQRRLPPRRLVTQPMDRPPPAARHGHCGFAMMRPGLGPELRLGPGAAPGL